MKLVITIDTEEDNWSDYSRNGARVTHTRHIARLQELFDKFGARPTYLITHPIATDDKASELLSSIQSSGRCEIGSHCHPWNTRPFDEEINEVNSMLSNLTGDLQYKKMRHLHETIKERFGITPVSFRCGRWGYNTDVAKNLSRLGYRVDTSITAFTDWSMYHGPDFSDIGPESFRFKADDIFSTDPGGPLLEVPATVGFLQDDYEKSNRLHNTMQKGPFRSFRLVDVMQRLNLLNKVYLSPELAGGSQMIKLAESLLRNEYEVINMFFHSPTLKGGLTPFVGNKKDEKRFISDIRDFLAFTKKTGIESITLSETIGLI